MFERNKEGEIILDADKKVDEVESSVKKVKDRKFSLPKQMMVGFYANIKKSDLKNYLRAKASNHMIPENTYFGIKKYQNGYLWELHEGGSGKGILSSLAEVLKTKDDVIIETSDKNVRVLKKSVGDGISSFSLNNDDVTTPTNGIEFKDKLTPVKNTGFGFFVISSMFGTLGVLSALGVLVYTTVLFDRPEPLKFVIEDDELPVSQMDAINWVLEDPNSYLYKLTYKKGSGWSMDKKEEKLEPAIKEKDTKMEDEVNKQLDKLKEKMNLDSNKDIDGPTKEGNSNE